MADPKKSASTTSSFLSTTNSLLSTKNTALGSSSLLKGSSLLTSTTLNTTSSLLSSKPSSLLSAPSTFLSSVPKPTLSSSLFSTTPVSSSLLSNVKLTSNSGLLSPLNTTASSLIHADTSASRKRKADPLESTVPTSVPSQAVTKKPATETVLPDNEDRRYNTENIQPIPTASVRLAVDLHCYVPAPKRPRIDPFHSIFARLENQNTTDDDFDVGIKSIKVRSSWRGREKFIADDFHSRKVCSTPLLTRCSVSQTCANRRIPNELNWSV